MAARAASFPAALRRPWPDRRAERLLGAASCLVLLSILLILVFIVAEAVPAFADNGLGFFGGGNVSRDFEAMIASNGRATQIGTFELLWATVLVVGGSVVVGLVLSLFAAIFVVQFAPDRMVKVMEPVIRLLAGVPSVVYGLIGILVLVPFLNNNIISDEQKLSTVPLVQLNGASLLVAVAILTVMISPIMTAIIINALRAVPRSWLEGSAALGANPWRVIWTIGVRTARPAIVAAVILSTARAIGEAIMLQMVAGEPWAPNPFDGIIFFFEPAQPYAASIVRYINNTQVPSVNATIFAFALLILITTLTLSLAGYAAKRPLRKYGVR